MSLTQFLMVHTVLVVDDEAALRTFAGVLLEDLGYSAMLAESGRAAVQMLLQDPSAVDLVLLDMTMPGMPPEETFRMLTEIRPCLPIIILSGELETAVRERFPDGTIAGYIQKPYTDMELEAALTQVLAGGRNSETAAPGEPCSTLHPPAFQPPASTFQTPAFQLVRLSDSDLGQAKQEYLSARRLELPKMADRLADGDFESLRIMGHSLKGSGGCFGLPELTRIGRELEIQAGALDANSCCEQLDALKTCLEADIA